MTGPLARWAMRPCAPDIRRYSEIEGGDDKITRAGAPEAHDKALDFILQHIG